MNIVDIVILICFLSGIIAGIGRGFIAQLMGLASMVLGIWLAFHFSNALTLWLKDYINIADNILHVLAFGIILIVVILLLGLAAKALEGLIKVIMLGWLNRMLGAVFSFITTFIVLGMIVLFIHYISETFGLNLPAVFNESSIYEWLKETTLEVFPMLKQMFMN